ncbi:MAG: ABC transporter ATP-binding protein, partial [Acidimicrobiales bacterium]
PRLLLVDEPTSQLDSKARDEVVVALRAINEQLGSTVVMVTHDPEIAQAVARTVTIRDGRVGAEGRHGEEYAVVGRDGSIQLPPHLLDILPPETLVRLHRHERGVNLEIAEPDR